MTTNQELKAWVDQVAELTQPDDVYWCNGSASEFKELADKLLAEGGFIELNQDTHPGCYLHRSDPSDVARVEHLTFVCTSSEEDAGPNNNWMAPAEARTKMQDLFRGCMKGRTMYVIPYCMGPIDSPLSRCGVEITDSAYVVVNMNMMTRMGDAALRRIEREGTFIKGLHSIGELDPDRRFIMHFPEDLEIQSFGSGYGGNALLGKKCHALRIASFQARTEGWLAEHMLIVGVENPAGEVHYVAAAFPSACGKTNLAMMIPPQTYDGWKIWTVGDDICWMRVGEDGRMWAINPEAGFFGVAPGTAKTGFSCKTVNPAHARTQNTGFQPGKRLLCFFLKDSFFISAQIYWFHVNQKINYFQKTMPATDSKRCWIPISPNRYIYSFSSMATSTSPASCSAKRLASSSDPTILP